MSNMLDRQLARLHTIGEVAVNKETQIVLRILDKLVKSKNLKFKKYKTFVTKVLFGADRASTNQRDSRHCARHIFRGESFAIGSHKSDTHFAVGVSRPIWV